MILKICYWLAKLSYQISLGSPLDEFSSQFVTQINILYPEYGNQVFNEFLDWDIHYGHFSRYYLSSKIRLQYLKENILFNMPDYLSVI